MSIEKIVVLEDDLIVRKNLENQLRQRRYDVASASTIAEAQEYLNKDSFDLIFLDVRLPDPMGWGRTGLEVLAFIRLHTLFSQLPVFVLTGYPLDPEEQDLIRRHRAHLFLKPDGYLMLLHRLDELTGSRFTRH